MQISLRERFSLWWVAIGAKGDSPIVYDFLEEYYESPKRKYHTLSYHIAGTLELFDECKTLLKDSLLVEGVLFFHDLFASEIESANFARDILLAAEVELSFIEEIVAGIRATMHTAPVQTLDQGYIVDIDLSFLALPYEEFITNTGKLREEAVSLSDAEFIEQTKTFFTMLLARDVLFHTAHFKPLEVLAKKNMQQYLDVHTS